MTTYQRVSLGPAIMEGRPTPPQTHRGRLITSCIVLATLICAHIVLIVLWSTEALQKHFFTLDKVTEATQAVTVGSQGVITILLVVLSYVVQGVAADQIIRRSECLIQITGGERLRALEF